MAELPGLIIGIKNNKCKKLVQAVVTWSPGLQHPEEKWRKNMYDLSLKADFPVKNPCKCTVVTVLMDI